MIANHIRLCVAALMAVIGAFGSFPTLGAGQLRPDDDTPSRTIKNIGERLAALGPYRVSFTAGSEDMEPASGEYVVDGDRFSVGLAGSRLISDGVSLWHIDGTNMEVTVDAADPQSRNILVNPAGAFDFGEDSFRSEDAGEDFFGGRMCRTIRLTPVGDISGMAGSVMLYVDMATGLPAGLRYVMDDDTLTVTVTSITPAENPEPSVFVFDPDDYPDYEIIDFR